MNKQDLQNYQQVYAEVEYLRRIDEARNAWRKKDVFNVMSFNRPDFYISRRWFGLDCDAKIEEQIRSLITDSDEVFALYKELKDKKFNEVVDEFAEEIYQQEMCEVLKSRDRGEISLEFDRATKADEVAETISAEIPFPKLETLLVRFNSALARDNQGALLKITVQHCPLQYS
jgi:hypothetical protein